MKTQKGVRQFAGWEGGLAPAQGPMRLNKRSALQSLSKKYSAPPLRSRRLCGESRSYSEFTAETPKTQRRRREKPFPYTLFKV